MRREVVKMKGRSGYNRRQPLMRVKAPLNTRDAAPVPINSDSSTSSSNNSGTAATTVFVGGGAGGGWQRGGSDATGRS